MRAANELNMPPRLRPTFGASKAIVGIYEHGPTFQRVKRSAPAGVVLKVATIRRAARCTLPSR